MFVSIIGFIGGIAVLLGFAAVTSGRLRAQATTVYVVNCLGGLALAASAAVAGAWPSCTVNVIWSAISAMGLLAARRPRVEMPTTREMSIVG